MLGGKQSEVVQRLVRGELGLALVSLLETLPPSLVTRRLYIERYVVVFPTGHPLEASAVVPFRRLADQAYVDRLSCEMRDTMMAFCKQCQMKLHAAFRSEREDWVQGMVSAGMGFAIMPEHSIALPGLQRRLLTEPEVTRTVAVASRKSAKPSAAADTFLHEVSRWRWAG